MRSFVTSWLVGVLAIGSLSLLGCLGNRSLNVEIAQRVRDLRREHGRGYPLALTEKLDEWVDKNAAAIIRIGKPAVPALLEELENQTPTECVRGYGKLAVPIPGPTGGMIKPTIRVSDKVNWILEEITRQDFEFDSDLPDEERKEAIKKWRQWWESQASHRSFERNSGVSP